MINGEYIAQAVITIAKWPKKHGDLFYTVYTVRKNIFLPLKNPGQFDFAPLATKLEFDLTETASSFPFVEFLRIYMPVSSPFYLSLVSTGSTSFLTKHTINLTSAGLLIIKFGQHMHNKGDQHCKYNLHNHNSSIHVYIVVIGKVGRTEIEVPNHYSFVFQYFKLSVLQSICYNGFIQLIRVYGLTIMSGYGFLTQSTIIPKKSKQIKLNDNSGQLLLQSIIQKQKQKMKMKSKGQTPAAAANASAKSIRRNPGIQQRIKNDQKKQQKNKLVQKNYYKILEKKAQVYDKINNKKQNIDKLLVDFQSKALQMNKQQAQQYQKLRQQFYKGKIDQIQTQQKSLHQNIQNQRCYTSQLRQRLAWQKQALNELNGIEGEQQRPKVQQSFDQRLSTEEKQAFDKIVTEQERERARIESIRRRRELVQQERVRKLRKLNIIHDVTEISAFQNNKPREEQQQDDKQ